MPRRQLATAMREQSLNPIPHLQAALIIKVEYKIANFHVSVTFNSRSVGGLLHCDVEAGEVDIRFLWWYKAIGSTSMTYSLCMTNTTRHHIFQSNYVGIYDNFR